MGFEIENAAAPVGGHAARLFRDEGQGIGFIRSYILRLAIDRDRVSGLLLALHQQVADGIRRTGSRLAGSNTPGASTSALAPEATYETRYEDAHATGVVRVGPVYPETSSPYGQTTFAVPIRIDEEWLPD